MTIRLNPYINFRGETRAAIEFYHDVFGGELTISTFGDFGAAEDPSETDMVMHSLLSTDFGLTIMAADAPARIEMTPGNNISVSLSADAVDEDTMQGYWGKLADGGTVTYPLGRAQWGDSFGMLIDKFGINWLVNIAAPVAS